MASETCLPVLPADYLLAERYRIDRPWDDTSAYLATDLEKKLRVIVHCYPASTCAVCEAQEHAGLNHPNLLTAVDTIDDGEYAYTITPHADAQPLSRITPAPVTITEKWLKCFLKEQLSALHYLHTLSPPVQHRNIRPENILLTSWGSSQLLLHRDICENTSIYAPLEQWASATDCDARADLYALAAVSYWLLTGKQARNFDGEDSSKSYLPLCNIRSIAKRFSAQLLQGIDKALRLHRSERWQSAEEWLEALPADAHGQPGRHRLSTAMKITAICAPLVLAAAGSCYYYLLRPQNTPVAMENTPAAAAPAQPMPVYENPQQLFDAVSRRDTTVLQHLLNSGGSVNAVNENGTPLLYHAVEEEHTQGISTLLATPGIDINKTNANNISPLAIAAWKGLTPIVKELIGIPGIDVNIANHNGDTALGAAVLHNAPDCIKLLLSVPGISVNTVNKQGLTPLLMCALSGNMESLPVLLEAPGIDINAADMQGNTTLHLVALQNASDCLQSLLKHPERKVNAQNKSGYTALHLAIMQKNAACAHLLLAEPDINVNLAMKDGNTPFQAAVEFNHPQILKDMIAKPGATPLKTNLEGMSPLHRAAHFPHDECLKILLNLPGIDINQPDYKGRTPLHYAATQTQGTAAPHLLAREGININATDSQGNTPLHIAASCGNSVCLQALLAVPGINIHPANNRGMTPLQAAAMSGHNNCVEALLKASGTDKQDNP